MFPEYRDLISQLRIEDTRFSRLFEKHNELDHKVRSLESSFATSTEVEMLKKEKLKLKDEIYAMLKKHDA